jgi:ABC-type antimicrobial peptide transport system permease subunit
MVFSEKTYLPAFIYGICASFFFDFYTLSPIVFSLIFLLLALGELYSAVKEGSSDERSFYMGFYFSMGVLFFTPALLFVFVFILILASLNIFLALTMIVISKKKDISILFAMGATRKFISQIFFAEGFIIGIIGTSVGLTLGIGIVVIQQQFGLIGMDVQSAIVDAFPVKMELIDVFFTGITTLGITLLLSIHPAIKASNFKFEKL